MKTYSETVRTQSKQSNLAAYNTAPQLEYGKVIIIYDNGSYHEVKLFDGVTISEGFDPADYALCWVEYEEREYIYGLKWCDHQKKHRQQLLKVEVLSTYSCHRIGYARPAEAREYKMWRTINQMGVNKKGTPCCEKSVDPSVYNLRAGDNIHLKSRQGIYKVVSVDYYTILITCNKWSIDGNQVNKIISKSDFKCYAGRLWNMSRTIRL